MPIEALGKPFDPHIHEAVAHLPAAEQPEGMVVAETRKGYRLGDTVLRPTQVIVSSGPGEPAPAEGEED